MFGDDPDAPFEGPAPYDGRPDHLATDLSGMALAAPVPDTYPGTFDERDYRDEELYGTGQYGGYEQHYPDDAARMNRSRDHRTAEQPLRPRRTRPAPPAASWTRCPTGGLACRAAIKRTTR